MNILPLLPNLTSITVFSRDLKWVPIGAQAEVFATANIEPVHSSILVAKLRPGQAIKAKCYCIKGKGEEHAKWSPVATATYRMLPEVVVNNVTGSEARKLKSVCPMNVFDIEDHNGMHVCVCVCVCFGLK